MQYILSEEEMKEVREREARSHRFPSIAILQEICTKAANEWPSWRGWDGKSDPRPWGCTLTYADEGRDHYCDRCPVQDICPNLHKEWSK
jgi:hypothetical protein